jgi:hypothetical protein
VHTHHGALADGPLLRLLKFALDFTRGLTKPHPFDRAKHARNRDRRDDPDDRDDDD